VIEEDDREARFIATEDDVEIVKRSKSGLIVTPDVITRARARVAAGESVEKVAFDLATEDVAMRAKLDNPWFGDEEKVVEEETEPAKLASIKDVVYGDVGGQQRPVAIVEDGVTKTIVYTEINGELRPTNIVVEPKKEK